MSDLILEPTGRTQENPDQTCVKNVDVKETARHSHHLLPQHLQGQVQSKAPRGLAYVASGTVAPDPYGVNSCRSLDNTFSVSVLSLLGSKMEER